MPASSHVTLVGKEKPSPTRSRRPAFTSGGSIICHSLPCTHLQHCDEKTYVRTPDYDDDGQMNTLFCTVRVEARSSSEGGFVSSSHFLVRPRLQQTVHPGAPGLRDAHASCRSPLHALPPSDSYPLAFNTLKQLVEGVDELLHALFLEVAGDLL